MLNIEQTRSRSTEWVRSPAFTPLLKARFKTPRWPFITSAIALSALFLLKENSLFQPLLLASIILPCWAWNVWNQTRSKRAAFRKSLDHHEPMLCALVIGNKKLFQTKGAIAPALLIGSFGPQDEAGTERLLEAAMILSHLYGSDPSSAPAYHQEACRLVNDDAYRPDRRRQLPANFSDDRDLWLFDALLFTDDLAYDEQLEGLVPCMVSPGSSGTIIQLPASVAVLKDESYVPNIINHEARTTPPPLVAPHCDNLEAVESHITKHLGEPETVFHELVSTTVHIDVHFVKASPERPWISLVTSGMSDLPMTAPEGAKDFRFAELMIRLPSDWKLSNEAFKQEENYWPVRTLKFLARFVHEYETWLSYGHTVPNGNPPEPLAPNLPFIGVILGLPSISDEMAILHLPDGTPVRFWSLFPLYPSEMEFKLANGADVLFERFEAAGDSDLFDPHRSPVA